MPDISPVQRTTRRTLSLTAAIALTLVVTPVVAAPANAAGPIDCSTLSERLLFQYIPKDGRYLGELDIELKPGATLDDKYPFASVKVSPTAASPAPDPEHQVQARELLLMDSDAKPVSAWIKPMDSAAAGRGLDGNPIDYVDTEVNHIGGATGAIGPNYSTVDSVDGCFQFALTFSSDINGHFPWDDGVVYYAATLHADWATRALTVVSNKAEEKTATSTALAASGTTAGSTTLTATVAPAAATGTVTFKQDGTVIGSPVAVTGGTAGLTVTGLTPNSAQSFTAEYSGDTTHEASTGAVSVNTLPAPDGSESEVNVSVPAPESNDPTGLKISVKPSAVTLSGAAARSAGSPWTATGSLGNVTVNDDRREVSAQGWTLSGKAVDFTGSGTAAGASIAASNLAWSPAKVTGAGTQGSASNDLSASRTLATGTASGSSNVQTTVSAGLSLTVPADKQAGAYQSKITLILI